MAAMRAIVFLCLLSLAFGGLIQKSEESPVRQTDIKWAQIQQQLEKLQSDLKNARPGGAASRKELGKEDAAQEIVSEELSSLDHLSMPQRRGVGWQPLKRSGTDPSFQLGFNDQSNLRQQMMDAVEEHLLRDLETARLYGIEPLQMLQDLKAKHQREQE